MTATSLADFDTAEGALAFWYPADDSPVDENYLPWGMVARGSSADTRLRVRNESDDYAALAVVVDVAAPLGSDVDISACHLLSLDGNIFTERITLADLPPNSVSPPFWIRRITAPDAPAGGGAYLLTATATSWLPAGVDTSAAGGAVDPATLTATAENAGGVTTAPTTPVEAGGVFDPTPAPAPAVPAAPDVPVDADQDWTGP